MVSALALGAVHESGTYHAQSNSIGTGSWLALQEHSWCRYTYDYVDQDDLEDVDFELVSRVEKSHFSCCVLLAVNMFAMAFWSLCKGGLERRFISTDGSPALLCIFIIPCSKGFGIGCGPTAGLCPNHRHGCAGNISIPFNDIALRAMISAASKHSGSHRRGFRIETLIYA